MRFVDWLKSELELRDLSQGELARRMGVSAAAVSYVLNELRHPGPDFCRELARVLHMPETVVFVLAGLLSPARGEGEASFRELWELFRKLPVEEQRAILAEARKRYEYFHPQIAGTEPATR